MVRLWAGSLGRLHVYSVLHVAAYCRYLAESGCTAMCVNLCKAPTQQFFTEQLGMPLTMTPDFETYSCEVSLARLECVGVSGAPL